MMASVAIRLRIGPSVWRRAMGSRSLVTIGQLQRGPRPVGLRSLQATGSPFAATNATIRWFQSEAEYHHVADKTLEAIQDALDDLFESSEEEQIEVNFASGVLTIAFPPHGTWVLNKQTPNRQIWWSSPLSGPRRYEYEDEQWVYTRAAADGATTGSTSLTLIETLKEEIKELYQLDLEVDLP